MELKCNICVVKISRTEVRANKAVTLENKSKKYSQTSLHSTAKRHIIYSISRSQKKIKIINHNGDIIYENHRQQGKYSTLISFDVYVHLLDQSGKVTDQLHVIKIHQPSLWVQKSH